MRGGLCRIASSPTGPHPLPLQCSCTDSILLGRAGGPLLEQIGQGEVDNFRQQIAWTGDRNCYDGFDVFWSIDHNDGEAPPEQMDFAAWKSRWGEQENLPRSGAVRWRKLPAADQPLHGCTPADFALEGAASDGHNIGFQADRLPLPPAKPAAPKEKEPNLRAPAAVNLPLNRPLPLPVSRVDGGRFAFYAGVSRVALPGD